MLHAGHLGSNVPPLPTGTQWHHHRTIPFKDTAYLRQYAQAAKAGFKLLIGRKILGHDIVSFTALNCYCGSLAQPPHGS